MLKQLDRQSCHWCCDLASHSHMVKLQLQLLRLIPGLQQKIRFCLKAFFSFFKLKKECESRCSEHLGTACFTQQGARNEGGV